MTPKSLVSLAVAGVLAVAASSAALAQQRALQTPTFVQPLTADLALQSATRNLPQFCAGSSTVSCPRLASTGDLTLKPWEPGDYALLVPNVRVSVFVKEIRNEIVANGGASLEPWTYLDWTTSSSAADLQEGGPYQWGIPPPGQTSSNFGPHGGPSGLRIYDALVLDACGSFNSFPLEHDAGVTDFSTTFGEYTGSDIATITHTGSYNMSYVIRVDDGSGGISDIRISGRVAANCSSKSSL